jgi:hypothetical protein
MWKKGENRGGKRDGAGRKVGSKNKKKQKVMTMNIANAFSRIGIRSSSSCLTRNDNQNGNGDSRLSNNDPTNGRSLEPCESNNPIDRSLISLELESITTEPPKSNANNLDLSADLSETEVDENLTSQQPIESCDSRNSNNLSLTSLDDENNPLQPVIAPSINDDESDSDYDDESSSAEIPNFEPDIDVLDSEEGTGAGAVHLDYLNLIQSKIKKEIQKDRKVHCISYGNSWIYPDDPVAKSNDSCVDPSHFYIPPVFVWLPRMIWSHLKMPCPVCKNCNTEVHDWPPPRRVVDLDKCYYILTRRYKCRDCHEKSEKMKNPSDKPAYTFLPYDPVVLSLLPEPISSRFPALLSSRSGLDNYRSDENIV